MSISTIQVSPIGNAETKERIKLSEKKFRSPYTGKDLKDTKKILRDFGIKEVTVPKDVVTVIQLERWKKEKIKNFLNSL